MSQPCTSPWPGGPGLRLPPAAPGPFCNLSKHTERHARRIAKRRIGKAAPRNSGGISAPRSDRHYPTQWKGYCSGVNWITGQWHFDFYAAGTYPISGGEDVSSFFSSGAEYFGGMAQECARWLPGWIGPGLVAGPASVTGSDSRDLSTLLPWFG